MMNSSYKSMKNSQKPSKQVLLILAGLSFLGFLDATYLTVLNFKHVIPPCSIAQGCEKVLTSQFASIGPIPLALLGVVYFLTLFIASLLLLEKRRKLIISGIFLLSLSGFISGLVLVSLQAFVLQAFCQYCLVAEGIIVITFGIVFKFLRTSKDTE